MACAHSFVTQNKKGEAAEAVFISLLASAGIAAAKDKAAGSDWDVRAAHFTAEVKGDDKSAETGNLAVEYENTRKGVPSGLAVTKADIWVYVLPGGQVWACTVDDLKWWFENAKPARPDVRFGGNRNATLRLFNREAMLDAIFVRLDDLKPADLLTCLKEGLGLLID